jgi:hypothetical protein
MNPQPHHIADTIQALEGDIRAFETKAGQLRDAVATLRTLYGLSTIVPDRATTRTPRAASSSRRVTTSRANAPSAGVRKSAIAPGSLPDRLLEILSKAKRPMKAKEIIGAGTGVDDALAMKTLRELRDTGRVVKMGATLSLRYALPEFAKVQTEQPEDSQS